MTRVALVAHHLKDDARKAAMTAAAWLHEHGHTAWMPDDDAARLDLPELAGEEPPSSADLVLSLGGDGTMLRAVGLLNGAPVPLLGVNIGRLGYLTEVEVDGLVDALQRFVAGPESGGWHLDRRMMLDVDVTKLREGFTRYAPLGVLIALVVIAQIALVVYVRKLGLTTEQVPVPKPQGYSNTAELGELLYTQFLYPFEVAAVILLVAIVAAITLTMRRRAGQKVQDVSKQVAVRASDRIRIVKMDAERGRR